MKGSGARYHGFVYGSLPQWVLDANIGEGDRIEFLQYAGMGMRGKEYRNAVGRVHMLGPSGPVVVMPGDRFGARPTVVTQETFVRVVSRRKAKGNPMKRIKLSGQMKKVFILCQCSDSGCPEHPRKSVCANRAQTIVYRSDMEDRNGTAMCGACAADALSSGVFYTKNPKRGRKRVTARGRIGRTIKTAPFAKYAQRADAAEAVFKMTPTQRREAQRRRFKSNPMSKKEFEFMAATIASFKKNGVSNETFGYLMELAVAVGRWSNPRFDADRFAARVAQLLQGDSTAVYRYVNRYKRNPLAVYGANPKRVTTVKELGRVVEIRYKRKDDGGFYKHDFKTRPRLLALSDGTIAVRP